MTYRAIIKKVRIVILDMPILDMTKYKSDVLDSKFMVDLVLQILSYVAERERINIRERQREGIALAKKIGKRFGRPEIPIPSNFNDYYLKISKGEISAVKAIEMMGLKKNTYYKLKKQYELLLNSKK